MCGIAGLMTADGSAPALTVLDRMAQAIVHRGPDGRGDYAEADVAMMQVRLAIIDLKTGDQPLYAPADAERGRLALIANGEIYNYIELRQQMNDIDYATGSDCESMLYLYREHGMDFAEYLRGMYAVAIHDPDDGALVLARDPFGIKPLYYGVAEDGFVFASEPQALLAAGLVTPAVDSAKRDELLALQFTTGAETIFPGIYRVLPGETLIVRKGRIAQRARLAALPPGAPVKITCDEALYRFDKIITEAVNVHQRSDVPYGMFLSGGIDSSIILAVMRRLNPAPVHALTAGFPGTDVHDEREHARAVARACGAEHEEITVTEEDFWRVLPQIAAAMDDPAADYAVVPSYMLAAKARTAGLKVVLSGEGGDELFAGYGRYRRQNRPAIFGGRKMRHRAILDGTGVLREDPKGWRDGIALAETEAHAYGRNNLQAVQATDIADWLPNDLLTKLDRCLMAHGVEGRVPFLDPYVADFAFRLPNNCKVHHKSGKWLLRKWLETALPESKPFSKKRGFTVPVGAWISGRGGALGALVAANPGIAAVCDPDAVKRLFSAGPGQGQAQWTLLFYALWHKRHIEGRDASGDVFAVLNS
ncbi:asparagine synthase (glutamine-hydrolyzing) [Thalassospiraceae bacterium LMO-JJ14]|nr:asparagine synthase (glutamine-hydrolyzing) [Thalassospiraceae bacterium LMO-JJ14]